MTETTPENYAIGMIGLGVMGRNLLLNLAEHGFPAAGYDRDPAKLEALRTEAGALPVRAVADVAQLVALLQRPRAVILLVPAGAAVDAVLAELAEHLDQGDLIIDAGNSHFKDTERREAELGQFHLDFLGTGISGGEEGARRGASLMPGGSAAAFERVRPALEAVAARVGGEPCVAHLGPGAAGHFVKMTHNGIEYGLMELLAESYDLMKRGLGLSNQELHEVYAGWDAGELNGYLMEITAAIVIYPDGASGRELLDAIAPVARQKGTGMWTSQAAMDLQAPVPTIDAAVTQRNLSALEAERRGASLSRPTPPFQGDRAAFLRQLRQALYGAMILTYAQGFALLRIASDAYHYELDLATVARIWRGGCIIRAAALERFRAAFQHKPHLRNLILDEALGAELQACEAGLRAVAGAAVAMALPAPAFLASLAYLDSYRSPWLPANLLQAQRDCFGAHTYERVDAKGPFHTEWLKP